MSSAKGFIIYIFIALSITLYLYSGSYAQSIGFFNTSIISKDTITLKVLFEDSSMENERIRLYFSNGNNYADSGNVVSKVNKSSVSFNLVSDTIPSLIRIDFPKNYNQVIDIKKIELQANGKFLVINSNLFISHPSLNINHKEFKISKSNLIVENSPYIYLKNQLYIHKIALTELFLLAIIVLFLSYMLFYFMELITLKKLSLDEILIIFLVSSLLLKEHWVSKVVILISLYIVFKVLKRQLNINIKIVIPFLCFFMFSAISLIWSVDYYESLKVISRMIPFIIIPVWLSSINKKINFKLIFDILLKLYLVIALILILEALIRYNSTFNLNEFFYHTLVGALGDSNAIYIALFYLSLVLFSTNEMLNSNIRVGKVVFILVNFLFLLLLGSKMVFFLSIPCLLIIFYSKYSITRRFLSLSLLGIFFLFLLLPQKFKDRYYQISNFNNISEVFTAKKFGEIYDWNGLTLRLFQVRAFYEIEKNENFNSYIGTGIGASQETLNEVYNQYDLYKGKPWQMRGGYFSYNFHNQYLQTLIEIGLIGFLFLTYIYIFGFKIIMENKNTLLLSILIMFLILMLSESLLMRFKGVVSFVLFINLAIIHKTKGYSLN